MGESCHPKSPSVRVEKKYLLDQGLGAIIQDDGLLLLFLFIIIIVVVVIVFKGYLVLTCYVCISVFIFWS